MPGVEVAAAKIVRYLLNVEHPDGATKAGFFADFGFDVLLPALMARALIEHAKNEAVTKVWDLEWGRRFHIEGPLWTPTDVRPQVRTVWQSRRPGLNAWFVTAFPLPKP